MRKLTIYVDDERYRIIRELLGNEHGIIVQVEGRNYKSRGPRKRLEGGRNGLMAALEFFKKAPASLSQLIDEFARIGLSTSSAKSRLSDLKRQGKIKQLGNGDWTCVD
jgi:hypothetical protein